MARQAIDAPPAAPPQYSLLIAATVVQDAIRWQQGIEWSPEQKNGGGVVAVNCHGGTATLGRGVNPAINTADPFNVWAEDHCSTLGFEDRDFEGRARRQLAAVQSAKIAREFQLGELRDADSLENAALVDGEKLGPAGQVVEDALAILEGAMAEAYAGGQGMIHVTAQAFTELGRKNLIYSSGQKWLTYPGNIVVMDAGYVSESGDPDTGVYMYGTTMVQIRLAPVDLPASFLESISRATNFVVLYAERLALVQFDSSVSDPADLVFKVELALPPWHAGS